VPIGLVVAIVVVVVGSAVAAVVSVGRGPLAIRRDLLFAVGLVLALIGVVLMPPLGWGAAMLTVAGGAMMLGQERRMFTGW
jgi:hypothetical protein